MNNILSYSELQSVSKSNSERLAYIDFKFRFMGFVKRSDLNRTFGLSDASASRMLSEYSELRENNLKYDKVNKVNVINTDSFKPLLNIDSDTALGMLSHGFNINKLSDNPELPYARVGSIPNQLNVNEVSKITRAMSGGYAINCHYISNHSSQHDARTLLPLAILFDGKSWIFRAYDRDGKIDQSKPSRFKNFNFSRATEVQERTDKEYKRLPYEELSVDEKWNLLLPLSLELNSNLEPKDQLSVRQEFGMLPDQKDIILTERAALLWLLTKKWNINTEKDNDNAYYKFILKNKEMVEQYI